MRRVNTLAKSTSMIVLFVGCSEPAAPAQPPAAAHGPPAKSTPASVSHPRGPEGEALDLLDQQIASRERYVQTHRSWGHFERLALEYIDRARLTGSYEDYAKADQAINQSFALGGATGPYLTRATLNYTLHRLDRVEPDLARLDSSPMINAGDRAAIRSLRADVAFHSGRYEEALAAYERIIEQERSPGALVALAQYFWKTGSFERAGTLLAEAGAGTQMGAQFRAWLNLVQGLMALDRGLYPEALSHYREGIRHRPGYWLLEEHEAEILALQGETQAALTRYLNLIARTQNPEFMDAAAECYETLGNQPEAARWVQRAREGFDQRVRLFPEASAGHAIDFYLSHDPRRALELAQINLRARPGGEAQVKLAQAQLRNNQIAEARATIERTLATVWNTADLHATASVIYDLSGDPTRAQTERDRALALNPHAMDDATSLGPSTVAGR